MSTQFCSKCFSPTNSKYFVSLKRLCGKCAKIHGEEEIILLNEEKEEINNKIEKINNKIKEVIMSDY